MATRAQKAKVGLFLLMTAAVVAGSVYFISRYGKAAEVPYYCEFSESVLGLSAGSPVVFLGVPVGIVDDIHVVAGVNAQNERTYLSHVEILVNPEKVTLREGVTAKLSIYSFATGTLVVYLQGGSVDGPLLEPGSQITADRSLIETFSSRFEEVLDSLNSLLARFSAAFEGLEPGELDKMLENANSAIVDLRGVLSSVQGTVDGVREEATGSVKEFRELLVQVKQFTVETQKVVTQVGEKLEPLDVGETQTRLNELLENLNNLTKPINELADKLGDTTESVGHKADNIDYNIREGLRSLTQTLESMRELFEYLQDNPSALIRGKGQPK